MKAMSADKMASIGYLIGLCACVAVLIVNLRLGNGKPDVDPYLMISLLAIIQALFFFVKFLKKLVLCLADEVIRELEKEETNTERSSG
jgi:hypothetical protein